MKCSAENEKRISTFVKGSTILKEWIEESNAALGEVDVKKTQLQSEIDSLKTDIELARKELEILRTTEPEEKPISSDVPICEQDRFVELYKRIGLFNLQENELRFLIVKLLSRDKGFGNEPLNQLREDVNSMDLGIEIDETLRMEEIRSVSNQKEFAEESAAVKAKEREVSEMESSLSKKNDELKELNHVVYYGPQNEFYKMKGQCYSKQVVE